MLLITHAGGIGERAPDAVVRAAMFVRLVGLARGGAGASPAVAESLAAMINANIRPVVPASGSVGAGDLGQMAAIGLVAIGLGIAGPEGHLVPGAEALRRAGLEPLSLAPKDGLALMSANGISVGHGALVVDRAAGLAAVADLATAVALEAVRGNPSTTLPAVASAKDHHGLSPLGPPHPDCPGRQPAARARRNRGRCRTRCRSGSHHRSTARCGTTSPRPGGPSRPS